MLNIDQNKMREVIQAAFNKATGNRRWETAIVKAQQIIESNPYVHMQADGSLLMLSDSNEIYEVKSNHCPCKAFRNGQPCKHRALYRLLTRYSETSH